MGYSITINTAFDPHLSSSVRKGNRWEYMYVMFSHRLYSLNDVYAWKERNAIDTDNQYFIVKAEQ